MILHLPVSFGIKLICTRPELKILKIMLQNNANAQTFSHTLLCLFDFFYVWLPRFHIVKQFSHLAPVYFFNLYIGLWEIFGLNWNITLNLPLMSMHAFSLESCNHTPKSSTWTSLGIRLYNLYAGYNALKLSWEAKHPAPQSTLKIKPSTV